jgi:hypothetical protein
MFLKSLAAVAGASLLIIGAGTGQAQAWERLGSRVVADKTETDAVSGFGQGRFRQIRLCVKHRAVNLKDVDVVFANGGHQDVHVRRRIGAGECTRAIDLKGGNRRIHRIVMRYQTIRDRGPQAVVTVMGR